MGIYVFSRDALLETLERHRGHDFGHEIIPAALKARKVHAYLFRGYWADVGTIETFYEANIMLTRPKAPFNFYDPRRPVFTRPRFLPPSRLNACSIDHAIIAEGSYLDHCVVEDSVVAIRQHINRGTRVTRSVLLGADYYEDDSDAPAAGGGPAIGIGRQSVLDRVIVDKNARIGNEVRLTNEAAAQHADGDGYYIRGGIVIVPKDGVIRDGTVV